MVWFNEGLGELRVTGESREERMGEEGVLAAKILRERRCSKGGLVCALSLLTGGGKSGSIMIGFGVGVQSISSGGEDKGASVQELGTGTNEDALLRPVSAVEGRRRGRAAALDGAVEVDSA